MAAGAKRVKVIAPVDLVVDKKSVATLNVQTVRYGGLEDD